MDNCHLQHRSHIYVDQPSPLLMPLVRKKSIMESLSIPNSSHLATQPNKIGSRTQTKENIPRRKSNIGKVKP